MSRLNSFRLIRSRLAGIAWALGSGAVAWFTSSDINQLIETFLELLTVGLLIVSVMYWQKARKQGREATEQVKATVAAFTAKLQEHDEVRDREFYKIELVVLRHELRQKISRGDCTREDAVALLRDGLMALKHDLKQEQADFVETFEFINEFEGQPNFGL